MQFESLLCKLVAKTLPSVLCILLTAASAAAQHPEASPTATPAIAANTTPAVTSTTVTTPGGTAGLMPVWTGTSTIGNSIVYQTSNGIGIGRFPNATLDIGGTSTFRGSMGVSRSGDATTAAGTNSFPILMQSSVYNASQGKNVLPYFQLMTEPTANNTASAGATFNFLYYSGVGAAPAETGLYLNGNGVIHFAPAQTFPITTGAQGPPGPQGPTGPAGPTGPSGPAGPIGPAQPQVWSSTTVINGLTDGLKELAAVSGVSTVLTIDQYGYFLRTLTFPKACTVSKFQVNPKFEQLAPTFTLETDLLVNQAPVLSCTIGYGNGVQFGSCSSSATYAIPAGADVELQFIPSAPAGNNVSILIPQVSFLCQ